MENITKELDRKREIVITKKKRAQLKDDVWKYGEEEDALNYVLFRIGEVTVKVY
jgi:hypothetical protein